VTLQPYGRDPNAVTERSGRGDAQPRDPPRGGPTADKRLETITSLKDRMCACTDAPCAAGVSHDYDKWENSEDADAFDHPDRYPDRHVEKDLVRQYNQLDKAYDACRAKLMPTMSGLGR